MTLNHSAETHQALLDRLPTATGRPLADWYQALEQGPTLLRFDERVNWLRDEYGISHGFATAIVHEYDVKRSRRS
jgi:hypothetical protein